MIVGPARVLFMDDISTGLDSSTTFQIVTCLQQLAHIMGFTILVSLLQPAPETYDLFDDIILMSEGRIVYHGPRENVLEFLEHCGFKCPQRKGIADFLQEVLSPKDQAQYWMHRDVPYVYIAAEELAERFENFSIGNERRSELSKPIDGSKYSKDALSFRTYSLRKWELFKACMDREWLLMKRNSFIYVFKSSQVITITLTL